VATPGSPPSQSPLPATQTPRVTVSTGTPGNHWSDTRARSRVGRHVHVSGHQPPLAPMAASSVPVDPYAQTVQAIANIRRGAGPRRRTSLAECRAAPGSTSPTSATGSASDARTARPRARSGPTATMVEVRRLIDPAMLVEIEAEAYVVPSEAPGRHDGWHDRCGRPVAPAPARRVARTRTATLHMWTQVVARPGSRSLHVRQPLVDTSPLYVSSRGLTTSANPLCVADVREVEFDFLSHTLEIRTSDGAIPGRSPSRRARVADLLRGVHVDAPGARDRA